MDALQQVLWRLSLLLGAVLVVRLLTTRLYRVYKWFFTFWCFQLARSAGLMLLKPGTNAYGWAFILTLPFLWLLYILVVLELYAQAFGHYKGLSSLSRWAMAAMLLVATGISAATIPVDLSRPPGRFPILVYLSVVERGLVFSLVLFLILLTAFLLWSPISLRRNVVLHAVVYSIYFLSSAFALFLRNVRGYEETLAVSVALLGVDVVCLLVWIAMFDQRGERNLVIVRRRAWTSEDEARLLRQMDSANAFLLRPPRK